MNDDICLGQQPRRTDRDQLGIARAAADERDMFAVPSVDAEDGDVPQFVSRASLVRIIKPRVEEILEIVRDKRYVRADSGDLEEHEVTGGTRLSSQELSRVRQGEVRYAKGQTEKVVERRPIVEETVVRRRSADDPESRL